MFLRRNNEGSGVSGFSHSMAGGPAGHESEERSGGMVIVSVRRVSRNKSGRMAGPTHCPECGNRLVRAGYCQSCPSCGWGACG